MKLEMVRIYNNRRAKREGVKARYEFFFFLKFKINKLSAVKLVKI